MLMHPPFEGEGDSLTASCFDGAHHFVFRYLLALRHKSLPSVPDVLPILSGSTELAGVGEVQFFVDQDTVYVVDEKIEVYFAACSLFNFLDSL